MQDIGKLTALFHGRTRCASIWSHSKVAWLVLVVGASGCADAPDTSVEPIPPRQVVASQSLPSFDAAAWDANGVLEWEDQSGNAHRWKRYGSSSEPHTVTIERNDSLVGEYQLSWSSGAVVGIVEADAIGDGTATLEDDVGIVTADWDGDGYEECDHEGEGCECDPEEPFCEPPPELMGGGDCEDAMEDALEAAEDLANWGVMMSSVGMFSLVGTVAGAATGNPVLTAVSGAIFGSTAAAFGFHMVDAMYHSYKAYRECHALQFAVAE